MWPFDELAAILRRPGAPVTGHPEPPEEPGALVLDEEGWLHGDSVELWPSPRHSARTSGPPRGVVWHVTAMKLGTRLWKKIETYDRKRDRAASWHLLIEADGRLYQSVSFERAAWHCLAGIAAGGRPNQTTVGIELAAADCKQTDWPDPQVGAAMRVLRVLADRYEMRREHVAYAHSDLDPKRRADPGPRFMRQVLPQMVAQVFESGAERIA